MVELEETRPDSSNTLIFKDLVHYLERELSKVGTSPVRRRDTVSYTHLTLPTNREV